LGHRAVRVGVAFNAATPLNGAARSARVGTLVICGTEVNTEIREWVTVGVDVVGGRRAIEISAGCSAGEARASRATSVIVTV